MSLAASITIGDSAGLKDLLGRFGVLVFDGAEEGMKRIMALADTRALKNLAGRKVQPRSRSLIRSVRHGVDREARDKPPTGWLGIASGLADAYAAVQEFGTVGKGGLFPDITPTNRRALAIPLDAAKDGRGVPIFKPTDPAIEDRLFRIDRPGKPPLLAVAGEDDAVIPMFLLAKRVAIKPKRYLRDAVEATADDEAPALLKEHVEAAIARAIGGGA